MVNAPSTIEVADTGENEEEEVEELQYDISSYPADFTLQVLYDKWVNSQLVVPDFQRSYVWTKPQASRLVESFLLGLPVPGVFLYKQRESQKLLVIDGHQRLGSIYFFFKGVFKDDRVFRLRGVDARWEGKSYEELSEPDRLRLDDSVLRSTVIQQLHPGDHSSIYLIFERLNTGGTQLNPMEIRKCLYSGPAYALLEELNGDANWRAIIGRPVDPRLKDVGLVLRVLAMARGWQDYEKPMKKFLTDYVENLVDPGGAEQRASDRDFFKRAAQRVRENLPERPFQIRTRVNLAAVDSVMATVGKVPDARLAGLAERYEALKADADYERAVTYNTSDVEAVKTRFEKAEHALMV